ncbi:MAG: DUF6328 family protein [Acidimicrobiales bacterium]
MTEDQQERHNRELIELLNELRVALPGVQVLFAFLLTVPFTQRFGRLADNTVDVYYAAVLLAALSSVLLIAPAAQHRSRFRTGSKEQLLKAGNLLAVGGTFTLALAMGATVYVISDLVYGKGPARLVGPVVTIVGAFVWFVMPLLYRDEVPQEGTEETSTLPT